MTNQQSFAPSTSQFVGLVIGFISFLLVVLMPQPDGLSPSGQGVLALLVLMAVWWSTEAIPIPATSLLPIVAMPMMGIMPMRAAAAPYADPVIFLLLGGFIVAMAMQKWNLHQRLALMVIAQVGEKPTALIGGFMIASAILSMWISNTATTLMMVPIALSVSATLLARDGADTEGNETFTVALLLGCAWSASIGGLGTIIGTPPNAFVVSFIERETGQVIEFLDWMKLGVPVVAVMVPAAWLVLTRIAFKVENTGNSAGQSVIREKLAALGPITTPEKRVAFVFAGMAFFWIFLAQLKTLPVFAGLSNAVVAVAGAIIMFLVPHGVKNTETDARLTEPASKSWGLLDWKTAQDLPWGVLLLFGGGLSLAAAIKATGLALWLGGLLGGLQGLPLILLILSIVTLVVFLTELTSNTATVAALVPVLAALAATSGIEPILLAAPTAMAASCAFMLPVATAPNAVVFASGRITIPQMARSGFVLNVIGSFLVTGTCSLLIPLAFL